MASLYASADAYVTPYAAEGFCLPALEALACGTPVLASAGGATDDLLSEDLGASFTLRIPPMVQRLDEIAPKLAEMLSGRGWQGDLAPCAIELARSYTWPGGFREMKDVAHRLVLMGAGPTITAEDLHAYADLDPEEMQRPAPATAVEETAIPAWVHPDAWAAADECERAAWRAASEALARVGGNKSEAARQLRMPRTNLDRLMDRMANIKPRR